MNRTSTLLAVASLALNVTVVAWFLMRPSPPVPDVIRVQRVDIVDSDGNVVGHLGVMNGGTALALRSSADVRDSDSEVMWIARRGTSELTVRSAKQQISLLAIGDEAWLRVSPPDHRGPDSLVFLGAKGDLPVLSLRTPSGIERLPSYEDATPPPQHPAFTP